MNKLVYQLGKADPAVKTALKSIVKTLPDLFALSSQGIKLDFYYSDKLNGLKIKKTDKGYCIYYQSVNQALRALGILSGSLKNKRRIKSLQEKQLIPAVNVMLDTSRNAIMRAEKVKVFLSHLALMGVNTFMLYTETTFTIPAEPYFGYLSGRYSPKEIREIDSYAFSLGIEMIPCVQTLAHLARMFQWPHYENLKDTAHVFLVDEKKTYQFIKKLLKAASAPYRSRKIHIGLDEANDLGLGKYMARNGYHNKTDIMSKHLGHLNQLLKELKFDQVYMWSDMYFRAASSSGSYYDRKSRVPLKLKKAAPANIDLVYWDYFHQKQKFYLEWIERHEDIKEGTVFAAGAWNWNRLWTNYKQAVNTIQPAMKAVKKKNIKHTILTLWGDDANEADTFSTLPVLQYYTEHCFNNNIQPDKVKQHLKGSSDIDYNDFLPAGSFDDYSFITRTHGGNNYSKVLFWEDPLFGTYQFFARNRNLKKHFAALHKQLEKTQNKKGKYNYKLKAAHLFSAVLTKKCDLPQRIRRAYLAGNKKQLEKILCHDLPSLKRLYQQARKMHRQNWMENYQANGWEVIEGRYGAMLLRLDTCRERIKRYIKGKIRVIEELEEKRLNPLWQEKGMLPSLTYSKIYASSPTPVN